MRTLLHGTGEVPALVVGNGVNRHGAAEGRNGWSRLLVELAERRGLAAPTALWEGISLTEFYDVLDLRPGPDGSLRPGRLQEEFCAGMESWRPFAQHRAIVAWARRHGAPVLTTNFDQTLAEAGGLRLFRGPTPGFTDFYPWECHYADRALVAPDQGFGVWHINGMLRYRRSIRLGLSHYMGSVERVRGWLHRGAGEGLYAAEAGAPWLGAATWVHLVFHRPLVIFGLGLEENEVFLRWLLIERAKYHRHRAGRTPPAHYVEVAGRVGAGKRFFLEGIGVAVHEVASFDAIYGAEVWREPGSAA